MSDPTTEPTATADAASWIMAEVAIARIIRERESASPYKAACVILHRDKDGKLESADINCNQKRHN